MKMEKDKVIIIALIAIIAVLAISIGYVMLLQSNIEYETINLSNGTTIEVPKADDATWTKDENGIRTYTCQSKHTVLTSFNSEEDFSLIGAGGFAIARDILLNGSTDVENYNNYQIKENTVNGTHYYISYIGNNETHDNIIIGSENLDILKHMLDSLVLGAPAKAQTNATNESSQSQTTNSPNGEYGYCAICGRALTASEANNEYTQGKVCHDCANNPYYQTEEGSEYANEKLFEAYPDEYEWMYEDTNDEDYDYEDYDANYAVDEEGNLV